MPVKRDVWGGLLDPDYGQSFPCSHCSTGRFKFDKELLRQEETTYSDLASQGDEWEPDWDVYRFMAMLKCDESTCGEICIASGDTELIEIDDDEFGWSYKRMLRIRSMFPAPPLFPLPSSLPELVAREIRRAFSLFWIDLGSCAARLRASLERLLDDKGIPKDTVNTKGKVTPLDLNGRIDTFEKAAGDADNAQSMHALRMVGNLGAHGASVSKEALFDVLDIYEDALLEIYEQKTVKLAALKAKIIQTKGKY